MGEETPRGRDTVDLGGGRRDGATEQREGAKQKRRKVKKDGEGGEEESQSPLSLMQFLFESPNLFEQTHKLHVHTLQA